MKPTQAVLRHVRAFDLTIAPVAARAIHVSTPEAHAVLEQLVRTGALFSYRSAGALYFTHARNALDDDALRESFAALWFCAMAHPPRELVPSSALRSLLGSPPPRRARCVLDNGELSLLRVAHAAPPGASVDLQRVLGGLQRFVESTQFRPWLGYAARERFSITCLVEGAAHADELARWLARHPLVAVSVEERGVVIPTRVEQLERLRRR